MLTHLKPTRDFYAHVAKIFLIVIFLFCSTLAFGQQKEAADNLVSEGVSLQDNGQVDSAISKYRHALELDQDNILALTEMGYSYFSINKYDESISFSKRAIKTHPGDPALKTVYVNYGNALDGLEKTDKAIDIYNEGIKLFPDYFQLYYNKGISQNRLHKLDDALISFQKSAILNPEHAGTQNAIGRLLFDNNHIPALMAFCRFLVLEPNTNRSFSNLENLQKIIGAHITKTDEKNITINVNPDLLNPDKKKTKNNFSSAELILSINAALDNDSNNIHKTDVEKFVRKISSLFEYLKETEKDNYGFYWDFYVPYFTELNEKGFVKTFSYIVFTSSKDTEVSEWLNSHKADIAGFYKWSEDFKWKIN